MTGRIRRAWAVLRGLPDPERAHLQECLDKALARNEEAYAKLAAMHCSIAPLRKSYDDAQALIASLRASLEDANAVIARLSAEAKARDGLMREAHALLGRAITDDGVPQP